MKNKLLIFLFLWLSLQMFAQEEQSDNSAKYLINSQKNIKRCSNDKKLLKRDRRIEKPNSFRIAPHNILNLPNPCFQIGYERFLSNKSALHIDAGIIATHGIGNYLVEGLGSDAEYSKSTNKGFTVKTGFKYILTDKRRFKTYLSLELFILRNKSGIDSNCHLSDPEIDEKWVNNFYYNDEQKIGLNIKFGFKFLFDRRLNIEPYAGIGIASRKVKQTGHEKFDCNHVIFGIFDKESKKPWGLSLPISCIISFRF